MTYELPEYDTQTSEGFDQIVDLYHEVGFTRFDMTLFLTGLATDHWVDGGDILGGSKASYHALLMAAVADASQCSDKGIDEMLHHLGKLVEFLRTLPADTEIERALEQVSEATEPWRQKDVPTARLPTLIEQNFVGAALVN